MSSGSPHFMECARRLALRGGSATRPNPLVGALLVRDGQILGRGWHHRFGGPHAEVEALRDARRKGHDPRGADLYVTLEPCPHHGKTPPCTELLIDCGVARVYYANRDPNPLVSGQGLRRLAEQRIEVLALDLAGRCANLNPGFFSHHLRHRPFVTLKMAQTLDGKIASSSGDSRWISSPASRRRVHRLRARVDAVLVGAGTVAADNPRLTVRRCRGRNPLRLVYDPSNRAPLQAALFQPPLAAGTILLAGSSLPEVRHKALQQQGIRTVVLDAEASLRPRQALDIVHRLPDPVQHLVIEGGAQTAAAFLRADLVDELQMYISPRLIGRGVETLGDLGRTTMAEARHLIAPRWSSVGPDLFLQAGLSDFCGAGSGAKSED